MRDLSSIVTKAKLMGLNIVHGEKSIFIYDENNTFARVYSVDSGDSIDYGNARRIMRSERGYVALSILGKIVIYSTNAGKESYCIELNKNMDKVMWFEDKIMYAEANTVDCIFFYSDKVVIIDKKGDTICEVYNQARIDATLESFCDRDVIRLYDWVILKRDGSKPICTGLYTLREHLQQDEPVFYRDTDVLCYIHENESKDTGISFYMCRYLYDEDIMVLTCNIPLMYEGDFEFKSNFANSDNSYSWELYVSCTGIFVEALILHDGMEAKMFPVGVESSYTKSRNQKVRYLGCDIFHVEAITSEIVIDSNYARAVLLYNRDLNKVVQIDPKKSYLHCASEVKWADRYYLEVLDLNVSSDISLFCTEEQLNNIEYSVLKPDGHVKGDDYIVTDKEKYIRKPERKKHGRVKCIMEYVNARWRFVDSEGKELDLWEEY